MSTKYRREGASLVDNETNQVVCIITDEKMGDLIEAGLAATAERDRLEENNAELKKEIRRTLKEIEILHGQAAIPKSIGDLLRLRLRKALITHQPTPNER